MASSSRAAATSIQRRARTSYVGDRLEIWGNSREGWARAREEEGTQSALKEKLLAMARDLERDLEMEEKRSPGRHWSLVEVSGATSDRGSRTIESFYFGGERDGRSLMHRERLKSGVFFGGGERRWFH